MSKILFPLQFQRQYSGPLDGDMVFDTLVDLQAYLTNPRRYAGQMAVCIESGAKVYVLNSAMDEWVPSSPLTDEQIQDFSEAYSWGNHADAGYLTSLPAHDHDDRYYTELEVNNLLSGKSDTNHNHDDRYYTETEMGQLLLEKADVNHTHDELYSPLGHTHDDRYYTETEIDSALSGKSNIGHLHDDRYYTESETDTLLTGKSNTGHIHDDRYYTETETDNLLSGKADTSHTHTLDSLTDISVSNITDGDFIQYNGTSWVNVPSIMAEVSNFYNLKTSSTGLQYYLNPDERHPDFSIGNYSIAFGPLFPSEHGIGGYYGPVASEQGTISIGWDAWAQAGGAIAIGPFAKVGTLGDNSIQLGLGSINLEGVFQVWTYPLLNKTSGLIYSARLGSGSSTASTYLRGDRTWAPAPNDSRITNTQITNWDTAYGWGDHSTEGYLTSIDSDLTAIAALTGTGFLARNGEDSWSLVTNPSGGGNTLATTITILSTDWSANQATIGVVGIETNSPIIVNVNGTDANIANFHNAGIKAISQAEGSITFSCDVTPVADISVQLLIGGIDDLIPLLTILTVNGTTPDANGNVEVSYTVIGDLLTEVTYTDAGVVSKTLSPNVFYDFTGDITSLSLVLGTPVTGKINEYNFQFLSGAIPPTLSISDITWVGGTPILEANKTYQVSILKGIGIIVGV